MCALVRALERRSISPESIESHEVEIAAVISCTER